MIFSLTRKTLLISFFSLALLNGVLYLTLTPPWQAPDEPTHFEHVRILRDRPGYFSPRPDFALQREIIISLDDHNYWHYVGVEEPVSLPETFLEAPFLSAAPSQIGKNPPFYYLIAALVLKLFPGRTLEAELYCLRGLSLFFSLLTVWMVFTCARRIFPGDFLFSLTCAGFVAFLPQFMVIGTSVSPDPLINLLGAIAIYLVIRVHKTGLSRSGILLIGLLYLGGMMVSYKFLLLVPPLFTVWLIQLFFRGRKTFSWLRFFIWFFLIIIFLILGFSWLVWFFPEIARIFIFRINTFYSIISRYLLGKTFFPKGYWPWFNRELFKSFWLKFGWLKFELAPAFYLVLKIATGISLVGVLFLFVKWLFKKSELKPGQWESVLTLFIYAIFVLGGYYAFWGLKRASTTTQGRHLFLVMPAWSILFVLGWSGLFPARWRNGICICLLLGFIGLDIASLFGYLIPAFHFLE